MLVFLSFKSRHAIKVETSFINTQIFFHKCQIISGGKDRRPILAGMHVVVFLNLPIHQIIILE